jgi:hypothetical protein
MTKPGWAVLGACALWWGVKMGTWGRVTWEQSYLWGALTNWGLLMVVAVLAATWGGHHRANRPDFLTGWKQVARPVGAYALLAGLGLAIWYGGIQREALELRKKRALDLLDELKNPEAFAQWKAEQGVDSSMTYADFAPNQLRSIETLYAPAFFVGMSMTALVFGGLLISLLIHWWWRNVLGGGLTSTPT